MPLIIPTPPPPPLILNGTLTELIFKEGIEIIFPDICAVFHSLQQGLGSRRSAVFLLSSHPGRNSSEYCKYYLSPCMDGYVVLDRIRFQYKWLLKKLVDSFKANTTRRNELLGPWRMIKQSRCSSGVSSMLPDDISS